jgi:hypothetical protein
VQKLIARITNIKKISRLFMDPRGMIYHAHRIIQLSHMNPLHAVTAYFLHLHLNNIFPPMHMTAHDYHIHFTTRRFMLPSIIIPLYSHSAPFWTHLQQMPWQVGQRDPPASVTNTRKCRQWSQTCFDAGKRTIACTAWKKLSKGNCKGSSLNVE